MICISLSDMSRYCIRLAYKGTNYCGWQTQPQVSTVQQTLETALSTLLRVSIGVVGCGRTDTGVHASDYYAHFDTNTALPANLVFKLNSFLPEDIVIFNIFPVVEDFNARFDAIERVYQYHVSQQRMPFRQGLYDRIYFSPNMERMNEAAHILMEYDNFTSFAKLHTQVKTNICHLTEAHWDKVGEEMIFTIGSNRFLRNMVRGVTGTLLDVGRGTLSLQKFREVIEKKNRCAAGASMPAQGLFLHKVVYDEERLLPPAT